MDISKFETARSSEILNAFTSQPICYNETQI